MTIVGYSGNWNVKCEVYERTDSINITNNTSIVCVDVYVGRNPNTSTSYFSGSFNGYITVDGETKTFSGSINQTNVQAGEYRYTGITENFTVTHNDDGSKDVSASFTWSANFNPSNANGSGVLTLTTIPRKTDCPQVSAVIKTPTSIVITPKATNTFQHSVQIIVGSTSFYVGANGNMQTTEYKFSENTTTIPITLSKDFYTEVEGLSYVGIIKLRTYKNNSEIGFSSNSINVLINQDLCRPYVDSYTISDRNAKTLALTNDSTDTIQYASRLYITLDDYYISDPDDTTTTITLKTINDKDITNVNNFYMIEDSTNDFLVMIKNSRGLTGYTHIKNNGSLFLYTKLSFNIVSLKRSEPTSNNVLLEYNGNYSKYIKKSDDSSVLTENNLTINWRYREKGSSTWNVGGTLSPTIDTLHNTYNGYTTLSNAFDYSKQYEFLFTAEDLLFNSSGTGTIENPINPIEIEENLTRGLPIFWWGQDSINMVGKTFLNGGCFDYSEDEMFTGKYWHDGRKIYKVDLIVDQSSGGSVTEIQTSSISSNFDYVTDISGIVVLMGSFDPPMSLVGAIAKLPFQDKGVADNWALVTYIAGTNSRIRVASGSGTDYPRFYIRVEYVKTQEESEGE